MPTDTLLNLLQEKCLKSLIPFSVQFELTYRCNLSCRHCYIAKKEPFELTSAEIMDILDQLKEMGTFKLILTGGEIFLRQDLFEIIGYAQKKGFLLTLMTNGTLITLSEADRLQKGNLTGVEISLYGASPRTHEWITQVPGSFSQTIQAIKLLVERKILVVVKTFLNSLNQKEWRAIKALGESLGAIVQFTLGLVPQKNGCQQIQNLELPLEKLHPELIDKIKEEIIQEERYLLSSRLFCLAGKINCSITPQGEVNPCVLMPLNLGNLREKSFQEIWQNEATPWLTQLRKMNISDLPKCRNCELVEYCWRCPGVAYLETGRLTEASQSACRYARWRKALAIGF